MSNNQSQITIRQANAADGAALTRLAQLDSARVPAEPVLLAFERGELEAAVSLADGGAVANPFRPTAELVAMLRIQGGTARRRAGRPHLRPWSRGPRPSSPSVPGFPAIPGQAR